MPSSFPACPILKLIVCIDFGCLRVSVFVKGLKCGRTRLMSASLSGEQLRNMRSYILKYFLYILAWWKGLVGANWTLCWWQYGFLSLYRPARHCVVYVNKYTIMLDPHMIHFLVHISPHPSICIYDGNYLMAASNLWPLVLWHVLAT